MMRCTHTMGECRCSCVEGRRSTATKALLSIKEKSHGPSLTYDIAIIYI